MAVTDPGRAARGDRQDDRPRAVRVHQAFEERYGVTAAAPAAAAAAAGRRRRRRRSRGRRRGADRVHRDPDRDRAEQDPGHQGRARADRPRPQGGQGPRRRGAQGRQGRRHQGRGREDQGRPRGAGRQGRDQVARPAGAGRPQPCVARAPVARAPPGALAIVLAGAFGRSRPSAAPPTWRPPDRAARSPTVGR